MTAARRTGPDIVPGRIHYTYHPRGAAAISTIQGESGPRYTWDLHVATPAIYVLLSHSTK